MRYAAISALIKGHIIVSVHRRGKGEGNIPVAWRPADLRSLDRGGIARDKTSGGGSAWQMKGGFRHEGSGGIINIHVNVVIRAGAGCPGGRQRLPVEAVIQYFGGEILDMDIDAVVDGG